MIHLVCPNPAIDRTLLLETFSQGVPNRPYEVKEFPGGKSFNVAYAYAFEENPLETCSIHTIIGGLNGEYLKQLAAVRDLDLHLTYTEKNTRLCNILVDTSKRVIYPVYESGFNLTADLLEQFQHKLVSKISEGDKLVFSGSLMKGMPADFISQVHRSSDKKAKLFVDTSGPALKEAYKEDCYMIKINDEEVLDLFPDERLETIADYVGLLKNKVRKEIPYFIITLGADGVIARLHQQIVHLKAAPIEVKNPIASGDFFLGALVRFLDEDHDPLDALKTAISYSTANCLNWYPEIHKKDLADIQKGVTIQYFT